VQSAAHGCYECDECATSNSCIGAVAGLQCHGFTALQEAMATDPGMMVDMMKKNLTGMVPQVRGVDDMHSQPP
jgi:hypothetical protein